MAEWVKVGTDVVVGGAVGAVDQLVQNWDEKREEEKAEKLGIMAQFGTYYNYGIPILAILGTAIGFLKGNWATRLVTAGSTLAGRKVTWQVTKRREVAWTPWSRNRSLEAQRQAEARRLREAATGAKPQITTGNAITIPVVAEEAILV